MKTQHFTIEQLAHPKPVPDKKPTQRKPQRKHWTDEFFKHLDAWGEEFRKAERKTRAKAKA
jgi:hypothetical protein